MIDTTSGGDREQLAAAHIQQETTSPPVPAREPHPGEDCAVWWESATSPEPSGRFTVTEHCKCGRVLGSYTDRVL